LAIAKYLRKEARFPRYRTTSSGALADKLRSAERKDKDVDGVGEPRRASGAPYRVHKLTRSERRVLSLVAQGLPNKEVADKLFVSVNTVKTHLQHIFKKLGVTNRRDAARAYKDVLRRYI